MINRKSIAKGIIPGDKDHIAFRELKNPMAADGMNVDKIAYYLNVSAQMVQKWIDESMSVAH